jgi:hypothetical protein
MWFHLVATVAEIVPPPRSPATPPSRDPATAPPEIPEIPERTSR